MCVCVCVCVCICLRNHVCVWLRVCTCVWLRVCVHAESGVHLAIQLRPVYILQSNFALHSCLLYLLALLTLVAYFTCFTSCAAHHRCACLSLCRAIYCLGIRGPRLCRRRYVLGGVLRAYCWCCPGTSERLLLLRESTSSSTLLVVASRCFGWPASSLLLMLPRLIP